MAFLDPGNTDVYAELQTAAAREGFNGEIAVVWEDPQGRTRFLASSPQHPFFQVVNYNQLRAQVNATLQV
ncbi:MAG: hypothetical protein LAO55_21310 [Acidobacteriia bacterium]|nr:hypothetical protein [Terriglobia bacterium]